MYKVFSLQIDLFYKKIKELGGIHFKVKEFVSYNINTQLELKIYNTYLKYHKEKTYNHVLNVANVSISLAKKYQLNVEKCILGSLLHDISAIMSSNQMYELAIMNQLDIDPAEEKYHFLLHQRISKIMAIEEFNVSDDVILSAIECHTTLKKKASKYDKVIFLADKIAWDQEGKPPYYDVVMNALNISLDYACYVFIKYQYDNNCLLMPHEWIKGAYDELKSIFCYKNE